MNDYVSAANRHYDDAVLLDQEGRVATASHLYGFVGECVLKALIFNLNPVASVPINMRKHMTQQLWTVFNGHSSLANFPSRISACIRFQSGYANWDVNQRYWAKSLIARKPKLVNERASARGLMSVLDQVQRGLL